MDDDGFSIWFPLPERKLFHYRKPKVAISIFVLLFISASIYTGYLGYVLKYSLTWVEIIFFSFLLNWLIFDYIKCFHRDNKRFAYIRAIFEYIQYAKVLAEIYVCMIWCVHNMYYIYMQNKTLMNYIYTHNIHEL